MAFPLPVGLLPWPVVSSLPISALFLRSHLHFTSAWAQSADGDRCVTRNLPYPAPDR